MAPTRAKAALTAAAVVGVGLVLASCLSLYGRHEADRRAHTIERRLAAAVVGMDQREAGTLLLRDDGGRAYERLRKEVGTDVDVTEFGSVLSVQANGWWLWAPRCVQARYNENGWHTSITHSDKCPDS